MIIASFPFETNDWSSIPVQECKGEAGIARSQVKMMNNIRIRKVEYPPATKLITGVKRCMFSIAWKDMNTELEDGRIMKLTADMTYFVGDNNEGHRFIHKTRLQASYC